MGTLFENLKSLYEYELYSNAINLASLILSSYDQIRTILSPFEHYLTLVYYAESLYYESRFRRAEVIFLQALQAKKLLSKKKTNLNKSTENLADAFPDADIKFKIAKCVWELRRPHDAITMLQSIPAKQRSPKINAFLGKVALYAPNEMISIAAYKEVIKECPLALEAIEKLLELGIKGVDINSLVLETSLIPQCNDWLGNWIKAQDLMYSKKNPAAIQSLKTIESNSMIKNSNMLLSLIGEIYYLNGEYDNALNYFKRAYNLHGANTIGIQIYSVILAKQNKISDLEKLIPTTSSALEYTSEMWYIMSQYLYSTNKFEKAAYFSQKSLFMNTRNIEAMILKAKVYIEMKKQKEALLLLKMVQTMAPHRYEAYKILIISYMNMYRLREAQTAANTTISQIGHTPRTLTLLARTYVNDVIMKSKQKSLLQRALEMNENYLPAIIMLAEFLQNEGDLTGAINLLKKQVSTQPALHSMLGDMLKNISDQNGALQHYTAALNLDPSNKQAQLGLINLNALGRPTTGSEIEISYTTSPTTEEVNDIGTEFQEDPDPDQSESDQMWSDVEIEINQPGN